MYAYCRAKVACTVGARDAATDCQGEGVARVASRYSIERDLRCTLRGNAICFLKLKCFNSLNSFLTFLIALYRNGCECVVHADGCCCRGWELLCTSDTSDTLAYGRHGLLGNSGTTLAPPPPPQASRYSGR